MIFEYDHIEVWGHWMRAAMAEIMPPGILEDLKRQKFKFLEDAFDFLMEHMTPERVMAQISTSFSSCSFRVYHGTRLTDSELSCVRLEGLKPLSLESRRQQIISRLKEHPGWNQFSEAKLDRAMRSMAINARQDDCVHVCFSRHGLVQGCNHYLTHGAEVDGVLAHAVLGETADEFLLKDRRPFVISFLAPFSEAVAAAQGTGNSLEARFAFLKHLLRRWAYWELHPDFRTTAHPDDSAARFSGPISAERIERIQNIHDADLTPRS